MNNNCPTCGTPALGNQIVELRHAMVDEKMYATVCSKCGCVYESQKANEQMRSMNE